MAASPFEELREIGAVFASRPESMAARKAMKAAYQRGAGVDEMLAIMREQLGDTAPTVDDLLSAMPEAMRNAITPEAGQALHTAFELSMAQALATYEETGEAPALGADAIEQFSIHVDYQEIDGVQVPFIQAVIYPFIDPEAQIARLLKTCYETFPPEAFARPRNGVRDAEWFSRYRQGETCRQIALTDERSGIAPEAMVTPDEYPEEVLRAESRVKKAVARFRDRWTKKLGFVSPDSA